MRAAEFRVTDGGPRTGQVFTLFGIAPDMLIQARGLGRMFDVGPDGRFLMLRETQVVEPTQPVVLIQDFVSELERVAR